MSVKYLDVLIVFFTLIIVLFPEQSHAYIDPGTASLVLQAILAAVVGGIATFRFWAHRVLSFFSFKDKKTEKEDLSDQ